MKLYTWSKAEAKDNSIVMRAAHIKLATQPLSLSPLIIDRISGCWRELSIVLINARLVGVELIRSVNVNTIAQRLSAALVYLTANATITRAEASRQVYALCS